VNAKIQMVHVYNKIANYKISDWKIDWFYLTRETVSNNECLLVKVEQKKTMVRNSA